MSNSRAVGYAVVRIEPNAYKLMSTARKDLEVQLTVKRQDASHHRMYFKSLDQLLNMAKHASSLPADYFIAQLPLPEDSVSISAVDALNKAAPAGLAKLLRENPSISWEQAQPHATTRQLEIGEQLKISSDDIKPLGFLSDQALIDRLTKENTQRHAAAAAADKLKATANDSKAASPATSPLAATRDGGAAASASGALTDRFVQHQNTNGEGKITGLNGQNHLSRLTEQASHSAIAGASADTSAASVILMGADINTGRGLPQSAAPASTAVASAPAKAAATDHKEATHELKADAKGRPSAAPGGAASASIDALARRAALFMVTDAKDRKASSSTATSSLTPMSAARRVLFGQHKNTLSDKQPVVLDEKNTFILIQHAGDITNLFEPQPNDKEMQKFLEAQHKKFTNFMMKLIAANGDSNKIKENIAAIGKKLGEINIDLATFFNGAIPDNHLSLFIIISTQAKDRFKLLQKAFDSAVVVAPQPPAQNRRRLSF